MHPVLLLLRAGVCCTQSLSTFPEKVSVSNLKAVGALKNVGKGTMERVRGMVLIRAQDIFEGCPGEGAGATEQLWSDAPVGKHWQLVGRLVSTLAPGNCGCARSRHVYL
jgi:hypothetical protein